MKKILIFFIAIIIVIAIIFMRYSSYKIQKDSIIGENAEYEEYLDKEIYGLDLGSLINKTIDKNTKNKVETNEDGSFKENDQNSIKLEIYIKDNETAYKMETFYNGGIETFIKYYGSVKFKCSKIDYHKNTGRIKYIFFEQL